MTEATSNAVAYRVTWRSGARIFIEHVPDSTAGVNGCVEVLPLCSAELLAQVTAERDALREALRPLILDIDGLVEEVEIEGWHDRFAYKTAKAAMRKLEALALGAGDKEPTDASA